jgi:hypothetical protein
MIGLSIHFEKWVWIDYHIFVMDFDWIDNTKIGLSNSLPTLHNGESDQTALKVFLSYRSINRKTKYK